MSKLIDVLLLLALPAAGKSEIRRYLNHLDPTTLRNDMRLGPTVQLDDYPYVHLLRRISEELKVRDADPIFFADEASPWNDPFDWLTLVHLLNEDCAALSGADRRDWTPGGLLERIDRARRAAGTTSVFGSLDAVLRSELETSLQADAAHLAEEVPAARPEGSTAVIEFARGGPAGAEPPLPHPLGYAASLAALDDTILSKAACLYVWVEPEESRRRNRDRAEDGGQGSILHHGVPEAVMIGEYGMDDMTWLADRNRKPGTIPVGPHDLRFARFDNRVDRTSFLRADPAEWDDDDVAKVHRDLAAALATLAAAG